MDWNTLKEAGLEIVKVILGSSIAIGIFAFIAKSSIGQFLDRRLEKYKVELAKELSVFNYQLSKISKIYEYAAKASRAFLLDTEKDLWSKEACQNGEAYLAHINENKTALNPLLVERIEPLNEKLTNILSQIESYHPRVGINIPGAKNNEKMIAELALLYKQGAELSRAILMLLDTEMREGQLHYNNDASL